MTTVTLDCLGHVTSVCHANLLTFSRYFLQETKKNTGNHGGEIQCRAERQLKAVDVFEKNTIHLCSMTSYAIPLQTAKENKALTSLKLLEKINKFS